MAEDDQKSGIGLQDADSLDAKSTPLNQPQNQSFSRSLMKPEMVRLGKSFLNGSVRIDSILIDGYPPSGLSAIIYRDSTIIVRGDGLNVLDEWEIERKGERPLIFSKIQSQTSGQVILNMANAIGGSLRDEESVGLGFYASRISGRERRLNFVFKYSSGKTEEEDKAKKSKSPQETDGGGGNKSRGTNVVSGAAVAGALKQAAGAAQAAVGASAAATASTVEESAGAVQGGGRVVATGQTNIGKTLTNQVIATGTQRAGVEEKVEVGSPVKGELKADTKIKTEVKASQAPVSGGDVGGVAAKKEISSEIEQKGGGEARTEIRGGGGGVGGTARTGISSEIEQKGGGGGGEGGSATVTGQPAVAASASSQPSKTQQTGGGAGDSVTETVKGNIKQQGEVTAKERVSVEQAPSSGGPTETQISAPASAPSASAPTQSPSQASVDGAAASPAGLGTTAIAGGSTAVAGTGLPAFRSQTPVMPSMPSAPASLGLMKQLDLERERGLRLSMAAGGAAAPLAAGKPAPGGLGSQTPPPEGEAETPESQGGEPSEEEKQQKQKAPAARPAGEGGKGLPAQEPAAAENPAEEATPPHEAPPGPAGVAEPDTEVEPPLGKTGGLHDQKPEEPEGQQAGQPGRPLDSANGPKQPGIGEPLQGPQTPETGDGAPGGPPPAEAKSGPPGLAPGAEKAAGGALPETAAAPEAGAVAGAEAAGALAGAEAGLAAAAPPVAAALVVQKLLTPKTKWWIAFGSSFLVLLTFFGFFVAWWQMVKAWREGNKAGPEKSLGQGQKIVTVIHFFTPFLLVAGFVILVLIVGCNWPLPKVPNYRGTAVGLIIGDDCKYFDVSNITGSGGNATSNTPAASTQATNGPITPR